MNIANYNNNGKLDRPKLGRPSGLKRHHNYVMIIIMRCSENNYIEFFFHGITPPSFPFKVSVTEDGLTGITIKKFTFGIGTSFTRHYNLMNFHYIDEKKIISYNYCL